MESKHDCRSVQEITGSRNVPAAKNNISAAQYNAGAEAIAFEVYYYRDSAAGLWAEATQRRSAALFVKDFAAVRSRKYCYEYVIQVLRDKPVVRLQMNYLSSCPAPGNLTVEAAWLMLNVHSPQFSCGCGAFFSETLEQSEMEQPPAAVMARVMQLAQNILINSIRSR